MESIVENWLFFVIWIVIIGGFIGYSFVKKSSNRKAAQTGEDKALVRNAAAPLIGEGGDTQIIYAHWEKSEHYGRTTRTTYFRYVVTYQDQTLCIAPLYIDKTTRQMQIAQPSIFTPENLGKVVVHTRLKNGAADHIGISLADKQGNTVFQLDVDAENLKKSRWFPVNIEQREECAAFASFMTSLAQRVAADNPGVDAIIKANSNKSLGTIGAVLSGIGAFVSFLFPPLGVILSLPGLIMSVVSKLKGAKSIIPLMISVLCAIWSAVFLFVYLKYGV